MHDFSSAKMFCEMWTSVDQIYSARKANRKKNRVQVSGWTCRTCAQNFRVFLLKEGVDIGTFDRKTCAFCVVACNYVVFV